MSWSVHHGDCLEWLRSLPDNCADAVITDPPYGINTKSDGSGKLNPWADLMNSALFYREWITQARRILRPGGSLWSFLNWRSLPTFQKAACDSAWSIESVLVWNKDWIGPGGPKGLRPSYELVALWAMPEFKVKDRSLADLQTFKWSSKKPNGHPAEKPIDLLEWIAGAANVKPGSVVVDPFCGSGTTGVAAVRAGAAFMGAELDPRWVSVSRARIGSGVAPSVHGGMSVQSALFSSQEWDTSA